MLLSYFYIDSQSPPTACEANSSIRQSREVEGSPKPTKDSEFNSSLLASISNWSTDVASSLRSAIPPSATSLFSLTSADEVKNARSYSGPSQAGVLFSDLATWFASAPEDRPTSHPAPLQVPASATPFHLQQVLEPANQTTVRSTTFTFCLFGAASTAAIYALVRNRKAMNRLQSAKSLAYRDARAWRRVALDFARINALAASRVQNLVATSLRDGRAGGDIGRQIERELEEATRAVAQRRSWIQEQDRKDSEPAPSSSAQRGSGGAWSDIFDPFYSTGFSFGSRTGQKGSALGEYGRWKPCVSTGHDDLSPGTSDGLAFKASGPWSRCTSTEKVPNTAATKPSAQLKWQRVVGHSAVVAPDSVTATSAPSDKPGVDLAGAGAGNEVREDWIGDVSRAIRERDRKSSQIPSRADQAAVDAFSRLESESAADADQSFLLREKETDETVNEEEDYLLPVSDLHIATNGRIREAPEEVAKRPVAVSKLKRTRLGPASSRKPATDAEKFSYPISDEFKDLHDIFIAAWDDNFAGLSNSAASMKSIDSALMSDESTQIRDDKPNRAFFEQLRLKKAQNNSAKFAANSNSEADIEFMAELMFPSAAHQESVKPSQSVMIGKGVTPSPAQTHEPTEQLDPKQAELDSYKAKIGELTDRLESMREMCHDLTDEASRREKTHRIQVEQLDHKVGLFTVWAEEVQRRLGLETPSSFASLRKPLKRD